MSNTLDYVERICENKYCKKKFHARKADVRRGWGRFCCKGCKAVVQSRNGGTLPKARSVQVQPKPRKRNPPASTPRTPKRPVSPWELEHQRTQANFDEYDRICAEEDNDL